MQSPQISVLMPTWNAAEFVANAIESILSQTFKDFELIVVDGASTDRTLEILSQYDDPRLRVLQAPAKGISPALNYGIAQARAPWVARQDADDISQPQRLEIQWNAMSNSGAVLSHTDVEFFGEGSHAMGRARFPRTQALIALRLCWQCPIVHSTVMFKRETVVAAGGYQTHHAEDYDLWGRLIERGPCVGIPQKLLKFRIHPVSLSKVNQTPMQALAETIAVEHCRRFMSLSSDEAKRAHAVLLARNNRRWKDWIWFLNHCIPRLRWKSPELYAWLSLQTLKMLG